MNAACVTLTVRVDLGQRSYDIEIGTACLSGFAAALDRWLASRGGSPRRAGKVLIATDAHVHQPHATRVASSLSTAGWNCRTAILPAGEQTKSLTGAERLYDELVEMRADRETVVVAVGGGVVGDLAGFAAATWARGVPFVQVPTTLLAQVDSSVGGKVGINHPRGKNLIGAFHQPRGVFIDTALLETLPDRDYRSGLAEVVKYGMILDAAFLEYLEEHAAELNAREPGALRHVVAASCRLKADVVERDEFERTGLRAVLNYGHTFGHAFEALCGYGELLHGEAVAIGMVYASRLAERLGRIDASLTERQIGLLHALGLPTDLPSSSQLTAEAVLDCMRLDKKSAGGALRFVLPSRAGHVELVADVPEAEVRHVVEATA